MHPLVETGLDRCRLDIGVGLRLGRLGVHESLLDSGSASDHKAQASIIYIYGPATGERGDPVKSIV